MNKQALVPQSIHPLEYCGTWGQALSAGCRFALVVQSPYHDEELGSSTDILEGLAAAAGILNQARWDFAQVEPVHVVAHLLREQRLERGTQDQDPPCAAAAAAVEPLVFAMITLSSYCDEELA